MTLSPIPIRQSMSHSPSSISAFQLITVEFSSLTLPNTTQISSIEILPTELPLDASVQFSNSLLPYIKSLLSDPTSSSADDPIAASLTRATIVDRGQLAVRFESLESVLMANRQQEKRMKVVMLGSGLVAGPAVQVLAGRKEVDLIIGEPFSSPPISLTH